MNNRKPVFIPAYKTVYVDVDDTLAMGNLSEYPTKDHVTVQYVNGPITVVPNQKNINLLTLFYKLGYTVIVWSQTGADWAKTISEAFKLEHMVTAYLTKPLFILDDKDVGEWMGKRRWRDPGGKLK